MAARRRGAPAPTGRMQRLVPKARQRRRRFDVFLNVPFDRQYEPLLLALVAALTAFGLTPRCVLEIPPQQGRLRRLHDLVAECEASIHDLSRSGSYGPGVRCARFNMPFELGLAVARALQGHDHSWIILETVPYRVQKTLSDLNGFDPFIHGATPDGVLHAVANAFHQRGGAPSMVQLKQLLAVIRTTARALKAQDGSRSLFTRRLFGQLVVAAQKAAVDLGIVPRP